MNVFAKGAVRAAGCVFFPLDLDGINELSGEMGSAFHLEMVGCHSLRNCQTVTKRSAFPFGVPLKIEAGCTCFTFPLRHCFSLLSSFFSQIA